VVITYGGGAACSNGVHSTRQSSLVISCVEGAATSITSVVENDCWYTISMNSGAACPIKPNEISDGVLEVTSSVAKPLVLAPLRIADSQATVTAGLGQLSVIGAVTAIAFSDGNQPLFIGRLVNETQYSTNLGICSLGRACSLGSYTILLKIQRQDPSLAVSDSGDDDDHQATQVCLKNVHGFSLATGATASVTEDCLLFKDPSSLQSATVYYLHQPDKAVCDMTYRYEHLGYCVASNSTIGYRGVLECDEDDGEATCDLAFEDDDDDSWILHERPCSPC